MHVWQLQDAESKLGQLIQEAELEPQIISRPGLKETVVMSMEKYSELCSHNCDIVSFFRDSPLKYLDQDIKRDPSGMRDIDL